MIETKVNEKQYLIGDILVKRDNPGELVIIVADGDFYNVIEIENWATIYSMSVTVCEIRKTYKATNKKIKVLTKDII